MVIKRIDQCWGPPKGCLSKKRFHSDHTTTCTMHAASTPIIHEAAAMGKVLSAQCRTLFAKLNRTGTSRSLNVRLPATWDHPRDPRGAVRPRWFVQAHLASMHQRRHARLFERPSLLVSVSALGLTVIFASMRGRECFLIWRR